MALRRALLLALTGLAAALPGGAFAQPVDDLQRLDAMVQTIGWTLARGNAPFCARSGPALGLVLQDARSFNDSALARETYGLAGDIAVAAVATGGPAQRAGLAANATVVEVAGEPVAALPVPRPGSWDRASALQDRLEDAAARDGHAVLVLSDGRRVDIPGERACLVRFGLDDARGNARATHREARIGRRFIAEVGGEEVLVAAILAHEMAHAVLDHQGLLDAVGRSIPVVRRTEREADRLSVWILANAGYDPAAAPAMIARIGPRHEFLIAAPSHGGWRGRRRDILAEIAAMRAAPDRDWARRFRRES